MWWWNHTQNFWNPLPLTCQLADSLETKPTNQTSKIFPAVDGKQHPHITQRDLSSHCEACGAQGYKAIWSVWHTLLCLHPTFCAAIDLTTRVLNNCNIFRLLGTNKLLFNSELLRLFTGQQSCSAAVTSSQTRAPWMTSSCGPMGPSRCLSWTYLCWTSGSVCRTCGRPWPVPCRSNPVRASPEGVSYASMSIAALQVPSHRYVTAC